MNTILLFMPIIISGVIILFGGFLIIHHEKSEELEQNHVKRKHRHKKI